MPLPLISLDLDETLISNDSNCVPSYQPRKHAYRFLKFCRGLVGDENVVLLSHNRLENIRNINSVLKLGFPDPQIFSVNQYTNSFAHNATEHSGPPRTVIHVDDLPVLPGVYEEKWKALKSWAGFPAVSDTVHTGIHGRFIHTIQVAPAMSSYFVDDTLLIGGVVWKMIVEYVADSQ